MVFVVQFPPSADYADRVRKIGPARRCNGMNQVLLTGRLTRDPDVRKLASELQDKLPEE